MSEEELPDPADVARREIVALEDRIERLGEQLQRSRKIAVAAKIAIVVGLVLLGTVLFGVLYADALPLLSAAILILGGIVLSGSNATTANQLAEEIADAQHERDTLIDDISPTLVPGETRVLH